jgi:type IV secretory pathway VirB2 component (pilin)
MDYPNQISRTIHEGASVKAVEETLRKVVAVITGSLFVVLAGVLAMGLGMLSGYPVGLRVLISLVLTGYGIYRARSAWGSRSEDE